MQKETLQLKELSGAHIGRSAGNSAVAEAHGTYHCVLRDAEGNIKWEDEIENLVTTVGKNFALDTFLSGSGYTVNGPYMGLVNTNALAAALTDTMASHAGWLEVGGTNVPAYSGTRKTVAFSSAASGQKASTGTYTFTFTSAGSVGGCFLVLGTGASSTKDTGTGVLYSAGAFTGGTKTVAPTDTLTVTYSASL